MYVDAYFVIMISYIKMPVAILGPNEDVLLFNSKCHLIVWMHQMQYRTILKFESLLLITLDFYLGYWFLCLI